MLPNMSTDMGFNDLPDWDVADRLAKSLRHSDVSVGEMAVFLGVHRNSVSAWINGRTPVNERTLKLWAERTGWPLEWLRDGTGSSQPRPPAQPFRLPQSAEPVRRLRPVADVVGDRQLDLVTVDDDALAYLRLATDDNQPTIRWADRYRLTSEGFGGYLTNVNFPHAA